MTQIDRRTFLLASSAVLLAACASEDSSAGSQSTGTDPGQSDSSAGDSGQSGPYDLVPRFPRELPVPGPLRLAYSIADDQSVLSDGPEVLTGRIVDNADESVLIPSIEGRKRRVSEGIVYWDFHPTIDRVGTYTLYIDNGTPDGSAIGVYDPATILVPVPGDALPPFDTPTSTDARGVDPICTRIEGGPCPFHSRTLTEALASGKPVAYLIGTPAHCQFGTCAPGLEFLITASERLGDQLIVVHAEVFTDDSATTAAPAVDAYHLAYEPVLFLAAADGTVMTRLEGAWDQSELDEELDRLVS